MSRVALITGGQQGIGLGIATALVAAGYRVVLAAEQEPEAPAVQDALAQLGASASYLRHDLQDTDAIPALIDAVETTVGPVTTFVSNAGVPAKVRGDMLDLEPDSYDFAMAINARGAYFVAQEVARRMLARPSDDYRAMIFVTSVSAEMVSIERAEYCISKAAAAMMVQLFAARLAKAGIGVFELRPGIIETAMTSGVRDVYTPRINAGLVPAARWGYPRDIGTIVVPLAEGQFGFSTGAVIPVDGGLSIQRL